MNHQPSSPVFWLQRSKIVKFGVGKQRSSQFGFTSMRDLDRENARDRVAVPANTNVHNIPVGLGIIPRSEKYKGLNGGGDTNNLT